MSSSRVIVSLDFPDKDAAMGLVSKLEPEACRVKVGKELFTCSGPALVNSLVERGFDVFLDLKYHDIPNTVARACEAAARLGVWMLNVHTSGGRNMLLAAREAIDKAQNRPLLIGVTVLTSMSAEDLQEVGINRSPEEQVLNLAGLAAGSKLDGVVCSARESRTLRSGFGEGFVLVTPGIRPAGTDVNDQKRVMTPSEAIKAGSHYLVIGRPITMAKEPLDVLEKINNEVNEAII